MGELNDGVWHRTEFASINANGTLERRPSVFRDWLTADGSATTEPSF